MNLLPVIILAILISGDQNYHPEPTISFDSADFEDGQLIDFYNIDGWLYQAGDQPDWYSPHEQVDDWESVSLAMDSGEVPEDWDGIGWFKNTIRIDSTLFGKKMGIQGRIYGAMELYLNGKLIGEAGKIGSTAEDEESIGYFQPVSFTFDDQEIQHFAIRYSNHNYIPAWDSAPSGLLLTTGYEADINTIYDDRRQEHTQSTFMSVLQMGFFLALAMLHLIIYVYYRSESANLIYGFMMLFSVLGAYSSALIGSTFNPDDFIRYITGEGIYVVFFSILNLFFVYQIIRRKIDWLPILFTLLGLVVLYFLFNTVVESRPVYALFLYASFLIAIGFTARDRITNRHKELNVILLTYAITFVLILPRSIGVTFMGADFDFLWAQNNYIFQLSGFFIPIGYSVFLAKNVAATNRNLKEKLEENKKLASDNIQAEREKHLLINRQKEELEEEVAARTAELKKSLKDLESTQDQLVQQEKLASLGQLTAGIAHEIKNPLNFVNNFSEISLELIEEVREAIKRKTGDEEQQAEEIFSILDDIEANLRKIYEHGSRADSIVKSMLQHSRGGSGEKEPADLNALVREYVNLAFHGMRAGPEPINVEIQLDLDEQIGEVPLIAEDFSRVIVNLCNNAFDAMREKLKVAESDTYRPKLTARTRQEEDQVRIEIEDNGPGVPDELRDQIQQPFFTTKKGTEGTGLGLSISNDIISVHSGHLDIISKNGEAAKFIITIPLQ